MKRKDHNQVATDRPFVPEVRHLSFECPSVKATTAPTCVRRGQPVFTRLTNTRKQKKTKLRSMDINSFQVGYMRSIQEENRCYLFIHRLHHPYPPTEALYGHSETGRQRVTLKGASISCCRCGSQLGKVRHLWDLNGCL